MGEAQHEISCQQQAIATKPILKSKPKTGPKAPVQEPLVWREPETSVLNSGLTISELIKEFYRG